MTNRWDFSSSFGQKLVTQELSDPLERGCIGENKHYAEVIFSLLFLQGWKNIVLRP